MRKRRSATDPAEMTNYSSRGLTPNAPNAECGVAVHVIYNTRAKHKSAREHASRKRRKRRVFRSGTGGTRGLHRRGRSPEILRGSARVLCVRFRVILVDSSRNSVCSRFPTTKKKNTLKNKKKTRKKYAHFPAINTLET